jgi:hypothetical protein
MPGTQKEWDTLSPPSSALSVQVDGNHYKKCAIQPVQYVHANGLGFIEGSVIKYVTRWRDKNGIRDLEKARHFIDLLIELEHAQLSKG